ncbi:ankyrin repeat domain-containing protein [Cytobacillus kochii]|uniref:ankyrin repeat domain-containing protein n=1 Tax=Cytobacillus kochii TaxID=859143 RepID=UPI0024802040|nr:ankyrin repeat domain-containing protein [Cytobacillus kochii]
MSLQLIKAAREGDKDHLLTLLNIGANINAQDDEGNTAIMAATQQNQMEIVQVLIAHGADINIRNKRLDNVLLYAGAEGLLEIVQLAIQAGADTTITNRYGGIAIIPACERGHIEVVKELLTHSDTDVNHINDLHWTALLEAIILSDGGKTHQEIVQLLIDHGADITITDKDGVTPLQHARNRGYREMIEILEKVKK